METPREYIKLLKKKCISKKMLAECIYSVNKRAKNARDKLREYKDSNSYFYRSQYYHQQIENYEQQMEKYYKMKEDLLFILQPTCAHKQFIGMETIRVRDFQKDYEKIKEEQRDNITNEGSYVDSDRPYKYNAMSEYLDDEFTVDFFDYKTGNKKYLYFLYYEIAGYSFHSPIGKRSISSHLQIVEIDSDFTTQGKNINDLLSVQFVKKVLTLINSEDYEIVE